MIPVPRRNLFLFFLSNNFMTFESGWNIAVARGRRNKVFFVSKKKFPSKYCNIKIFNWHSSSGEGRFDVWLNAAIVSHRKGTVRANPGMWWNFGFYCRCVIKRWSVILKPSRTSRGGWGIWYFLLLDQKEDFGFQISNEILNISSKKTNVINKMLMWQVSKLVLEGFAFPKHPAA